MKGNNGKKFSLKKTPKTGITIYATMGRVRALPTEKARIRKYHGITTRVTKEMEEKYYEYQHKRY